MFANVTLSLMGGFVTTVQLFCLTLVFALPLGLLISFGSMSRITPLRWLRLSSTTPATSRRSSAAAFRASRAASMRPVRCSA